jgi:hypothetical protein
MGGNRTTRWFPESVQFYTCSAQPRTIKEADTEETEMSAHGDHESARITVRGMIWVSLIAAGAELRQPLVTRIASELPINKAASEPTPIPTNLKVVSTIRFVQVP